MPIASAYASAALGYLDAWANDECYDDGHCWSEPQGGGRSAGSSPVDRYDTSAMLSRSTSPGLLY
jgi:hypothetical protein